MISTGMGIRDILERDSAPSVSRATRTLGQNSSTGGVVGRKSPSGKRRVRSRQIRPVTRSSRSERRAAASRPERTAADRVAPPGAAAISPAGTTRARRDNDANARAGATRARRAAAAAMLATPLSPGGHSGVCSVRNHGYLMAPLSTSSDFGGALSPKE